MVFVIVAAVAVFAMLAWATHTHSFTWKRGAESQSSEVNITTDGERNVDATIAAGAADFLVNFAIDKDDMRSLYILATQNLTLETNNAGAPVNTVALVANEPLIFRTKSGTDATLPPGMANPFAAGDVTAIYITNASGQSATLTIRALYDATP